MAARLVGQEGAADALVSAGNTGAVVLSCSKAFTRIEGVKRTALAAVVPTKRNRGPHSDPFSLILDVGATIRVSADDLVNFASMGSAYASIISQNKNPKVALLSNGSESNKGTPEIIEAHQKLNDLSNINFIGNVEGVDLPKGIADVVVCDGFTGNVVLKMLEGVSEAVMDLAKYAYRRRLTWKLAFLLLSSGINRVKKITDWQQYGGAPILGFDQLCIKAHGRSSPRAIRNAIRVAEKCVNQDLAGRIKSINMKP
jgi:glycerol-3-phosphate acyltransferase PlsX